MVYESYNFSTQTSSIRKKHEINETFTLYLLPEKRDVLIQIFSVESKS